MKDLKNSSICILGLGIENYAFLKFFRSSTIDITICDSRKFKELEQRLVDLEMDIKLKLGKGYDKNLDKYDVVLRSPGYPLFTEEIQKAKRKKVEITSPIKRFMEMCPSRNIVGVTGSKGKGTTASLIYDILKRSGKKVYLGGNIGVAPFDFLAKIKKNDWVILELSSFQLEDMETSPKIAVFTNLYKEHLTPADPKNPNYHKSMSSYWQAKANIFKHQKKDNYLVINESLKTRLLKSGWSKGKVIYFSRSDMPSKLKGEHNKENVAAAVEVAKILKIKKDVIAKAVKGFKGLPHRLEKVAVIDGVKYYDDSFATTPEASLLAIESFDKPVVLLVGGADKGADFTKFASAIKRTKATILFRGKGTDRLKKTLNVKDDVEVDSMKEAVKTAKALARPGDVVLLSTGCASFGIFKNYKERGDLFKKEVKK